jgi:virginiamycin B lyase
VWFTNSGNNSIGRISTAGVVSNYMDPSISMAWAVTAGPDEALWFTNEGNGSIGRISTTGLVSDYPVPCAGGSSINMTGIVAGLDAAPWFT